MSRILLSPVTAVTCNQAFEVIEDAAIHVENGGITFVRRLKRARFRAARNHRRRASGGAAGAGQHPHPFGHDADARLRRRHGAGAVAATKNLALRDQPDGRGCVLGHRPGDCRVLRGGTCFADMYHFYEDGVRAMLESGIRACPGAVLLGFLPEAQSASPTASPSRATSTARAAGASRLFSRRTRFTPATATTGKR